MTYEISKILYNRTKNILRKGKGTKLVRRLNRCDKCRNLSLKLKQYK